VYVAFVSHAHTAPALVLHVCCVAVLFYVCGYAPFALDYVGYFAVVTRFQFVTLLHLHFLPFMHFVGFAAVVCSYCLRCTFRLDVQLTVHTTRQFAPLPVAFTRLVRRAFVDYVGVRVLLLLRTRWFTDPRRLHRALRFNRYSFTFALHARCMRTHFSGARVCFGLRSGCSGSACLFSRTLFSLTYSFHATRLIFLCAAWFAVYRFAAAFFAFSVYGLPRVRTRAHIVGLVAQFRSFGAV